jgi:hypothetical protein
MALTLESVVSALDGTSDMTSVCKAISHGSLMGARGNSGVILSQVLRGLADGVKSLDAADGGAFADAMAAASEAAYAAVMRPVEGTILTVVRESADAAGKAAGEGKALVDVLDAARDEARASLARTPDLLPKLREHGVVDAGAAGYCLLLDVLLHVSAGRPLPEPSSAPAPAVVSLVHDSVESAHEEGSVSDLRYEVMYFLEAPDETIPAFKEVWAGIGDSIVVVGGLGQGTPVDHVEQGIDEQHEAGAAGVDHAGLGQHRQELGGVLQGRGRGRRHRVQHLDQPGVTGAVRGVGGVAGDGEDRALHRAHDGGVGQPAGAEKSVGHAGGIHGVTAAQAVGQAPQDLGQDDPGVAPGAHERAVYDRLLHAGVVGPLEPGHHRLQGQGHVGAGVAVGDRVDVEPVEPLPVPAQQVSVGDHGGAQVLGGQLLHRVES